MKLRVLHRNADLYSKTQTNQRRINFSIDNDQKTPLAQAIQHQRALNAVKIDKIFAKPFIHQFGGHIDSVKALARCNQAIFDFFSGSCDGEIRFWSAAHKKCWRSIVGAHDGIIEGLCVAADDKYLFSCSRDHKVKMWPVQKYYDILRQDEEAVADTGNLVQEYQDFVGDALAKEETPIQVFTAPSALTCVDHRLELGQIVVTGEKIWIWDENRSTPLREFEWGTDSFYSAKWSPSETHIFTATSSDNSISLFDTRQNEGVQRVFLDMRTNMTCWNPQRPFQFAAANEDSNIYVFDIRQMDRALRIHYGFINAALDVDYSPAGSHIVGGSFDQTIRVWKDGEPRSHQLYHAQRMQIVLSTRFSGDGKYIYSGSADMNVRIWKTNASEILGSMNRRERLKVEEREALKEKFKEAPQIKRIMRHQTMPKYIKNQTKKRVIMTQAEKEKERRRLEHGQQAEHKPYKEAMIRRVEQPQSFLETREKRRAEREAREAEAEQKAREMEEKEDANDSE
eukprot:Blabericola_migrator_1__4441@NODE_237_length_10988_cov_176_358575_g201_i0_p2_GENE_NODE_237_length_10988_cov_176_358575_g201_i0NODE_237_length_10988_cov_176_358575_g201_i0_p2_ORF_typecomplete_len511_score108_25WD40/PF00400_32/0_0017WD40/PF00400_32/0_00019WD40/PF00400_32/0_25WD40/PF00400_32/6_8e03WD40/PF00400_32/0_00052WD40/PF00400_32/3e05ANAPC4_WD40/PF12894_7/2_6e05ANAPC4_WD40/PF12894_7/0_00068ANAPC4_WD40/PF12894_7/0_006ANAPC4_WD40/PF12894_7/0_00017Sof1/PF04158_14/4_3e18Sof1/PF04158_14/8_1e03eIF2